MKLTVRFVAVANFQLEITNLSINIKVEIRVATKRYHLVIIALVIFSTILPGVRCYGISIELSIVNTGNRNSLLVDFLCLT